MMDIFISLCTQTNIFFKIVITAAWEDSEWEQMKVFLSPCICINEQAFALFIYTHMLSLSFSLTHAHTLFLTHFSLSGLFIKWTKAISFSEQAEVRTILCSKKHFSPNVRFCLFLTQLMLAFFSLDCALLPTLYLSSLEHYAISTAALLSSLF